MIPERLVTFIIRHPIGLHIIQGARFSSRCEQFRDVGVGPRLVAVLAVGAYLLSQRYSKEEKLESEELFYDGKSSITALNIELT
jgi:hypothetical protein